MKRILILLSSILVMFACSKENTQTVDSGQNPDQMAAITGAASSISCYFADLSGKAVIPSMTTTDMSFGVLYSTSSGVLINTATKKEAQSFDSNYNFTITTDKISPGTTYYYRSYLSMGGMILYGEVKSFTTLKIQASVTAESSNVSYHTATISGKLTVTSEGTFTKSASLYHSSTATTLDALKSTGTQQTITLNSDGTYSTDVNGLAYNAKIYYCVVAKVDDVEFASSVNNLTTKSLPAGPVDMGLSVKWASVNIGATNPWDSGRYFAWGDVTGQTWNGSSWSGSGFLTSPTYEVDSNNNLKPAYDAAHVILGSTWRMPTEAEFKELIDNCTCTWTDNYNSTGVAGRIFTSKKTGYTDKSIFLPAAGYVYGSRLTNAGSDGNYWSSTFNNGNNAWYLYFNSSHVHASSSIRFIGQSIRPVTE